MGTSNPSQNRGSNVKFLQCLIRDRSRYVQNAGTRRVSVPRRGDGGTSAHNRTMWICVVLSNRKNCFNLKMNIRKNALPDPTSQTRKKIEPLKTRGVKFYGSEVWCCVAVRWGTSTQLGMSARVSVAPSANLNTRPMPLLCCHQQRLPHSHGVLA